MDAARLEIAPHVDAAALLPNRVDPWGDLHAARDHGLLTGNRGCLAGASGAIIRRQRSVAWITCVLRFRDHRQPLVDPRRWTPLFFLDEAVALAAGHRPCAYCRRSAYRAYTEAAAPEGTPRANAALLNRTLAEERYPDSRPATGGLACRAPDRRTWLASPGTLPIGTVIVDAGGGPVLIGADGQQYAFSFSGWRPVVTVDAGVVRVLTPPTSVAALRNGYRPLLHESASK